MAPVGMRITALIAALITTSVLTACGESSPPAPEAQSTEHNAADVTFAQKMIPHHQQAQIFGRFMRADNARAWGISGTGLGLYICRELVERHGGLLWFESEEDAGSTFFVTLPLVSARQGDHEVPS